MSSEDRETSPLQRELRDLCEEGYRWVGEAPFTVEEGVVD